MTEKRTLRTAARELRRQLWSLRAAFYAGLLLLAGSLPTLVQMAREEVAERRADRRYTVRRIHRGLDSVFAGHFISVGDRYRRGESALTPVVDGPVSIRIDGKDYSIPATLRIDTTVTDAGRYWNYLSVGILLDNELGTRRFFVAQCLPADTLRPYPMSMSWRLLFVSAEGVVSDEVFGFDERGRELYRTVIARTASPVPLGFHSQVRVVWPTLLFPFLYPFLSTLLGGVLLGARAWVPWLKPRLRLA